MMTIVRELQGITTVFCQTRPIASIDRSSLVTVHLTISSDFAWMLTRQGQVVSAGDHNHAIDCLPGRFKLVVTANGSRRVFQQVSRKIRSAREWALAVLDPDREDIRAC